MGAFAYASIVLSLAAFILSLLCLLAGYTPGFIEDADIMTITISSTGKALLWNDTQSGGNDISSELDSLTSQVGINDWYAMHVMNYCEGSYANSTSQATESCSENVPFFSFNPIEIIVSQSEKSFDVSLGKMGASVTLSTSGWLSEIDSVAKKAVTAYKVMFFLLCMGIAASGVEAIVSTIVIVMDRPSLGHGTAVSYINLGLGVIAFLGLSLASSIITATMITVVNTINKKGASVGLGATQGTKFLWLVWASTILMLLTVCVWLLDWSVQKRLFYNFQEYDYKSQKAALKAEKKLFKQRLAMEHETIKSAQSVPPSHSRGLVAPLAGAVARHVAFDTLDNGLGMPTTPYHLAYEPQWVAPPRVVPRDFV